MPLLGAARRVWTSFGLKGVAFAPIDNGDGPIGLVALGTRDPKVAAQIDDQLPGRDRVRRRGAQSDRRAAGAPRRARKRVADGSRASSPTQAFDPVFQPIVRMRTGEAIGFEALTRFHDGTRPDLVFAEAAAAEVGLDLEAATLAKAMAAARSCRLTHGSRSTCRPR